MSKFLQKQISFQISNCPISLLFLTERNFSWEQIIVYFIYVDWCSLSTEYFRHQFRCQQVSMAMQRAYILKYIHSTCVIAIYSVQPSSSLFRYKSFIHSNNEFYMWNVDANIDAFGIWIKKMFCWFLNVHALVV